MSRCSPGAKPTWTRGTAGRSACRRRVAWRARGVGVAVVLLLAATRPATAHEIGTTQVTVRLGVESRRSGGTYEIAVETDAEALVEKLEAVADRSVPGARGADLATRLAALEDTFRQRVDISFDGSASRPAMTFRIAPPQDSLSSSAATILLTGPMPRGDVRFVWRYGWTVASYALQVAGPTDSAPVVEWLEGGETSRPYTIDASALPSHGRLSVAGQYLTLGFTHIVPGGLDHVLFVIGLFLLSTRWRPVLWQVSAFTLAHSITLGLGMYGVISVPPAIVEPLIALSIVFVSVENLMRSDLHVWRLGLVFAFGLLHGLGFVGVLTGLGLPPSEFLTALLSFNVGVETGQLLVLAGAFAVVGWYRGHAPYRSRVVVPASVAIASVGMYWTIERVLLLL